MLIQQFTNGILYENGVISATWLVIRKTACKILIHQHKIVAFSISSSVGFPHCKKIYSTNNHHSVEVFVAKCVVFYRLR